MIYTVVSDTFLTCPYIFLNTLMAFILLFSQLRQVDKLTRQALLDPVNLDVLLSLCPLFETHFRVGWRGQRSSKSKVIAKVIDAWQ